MGRPRAPHYGVNSFATRIIPGPALSPLGLRSVGEILEEARDFVRCCRADGRMHRVDSVG